MREYVIGWALVPPATSSMRWIGKDWTIEARQLPRLKKYRRYPLRTRRDFLPPEVVIRARNRPAAQRVASTLHAADSVVNGSVSGAFIFGLEALRPPLAVPLDARQAEDVPQNVVKEKREAQHSMSSSYESAIRLATRVSHRRRLQYALFKLYSSMTHVSVEFMSTHPDDYDPTNFPAATGADEQVRVAVACTLAYSAIEELGLEVRPQSPRKRQPPTSKINGKWLHAVLDDVQQRLRRAGVKPNATLAWLVRGPPRKLERQRRVPQGRKPQWARRAIRDRLVTIPELLDLARYIRNRVTAHRLDSRVRSLTALDVANMQHLARYLLLARTQCLRP